MPPSIRRTARSASRERARRRKSSSPRGRSRCSNDLMASLRAIRLVRHGAPLVEQDIAEPAPRDGEVLMEIRAAGICHSDAHYRADPGRVPLPRTLGHEIAGINVATGERVAVHYLFANGDMIGKERDGGYAEKIVVPA